MYEMADFHHEILIVLFGLLNLRHSVIKKSRDTFKLEK